VAGREKKYYWLKLKRDFFKRHDIRIIEKMQNGKDYVLFYLKMLLESIDHEGELRFSDAIPYNEEMLSVITDTNVDVIRQAMRIFIDLGMIEVLEDETIYMNEVQKMIGSESAAAERVRRHRQSAESLPEP
jgi:predicted phage replisome organizer